MCISMLPKEEINQIKMRLIIPVQITRCYILRSVLRFGCVALSKRSCITAWISTSNFLSLSLYFLFPWSHLYILFYVWIFCLHLVCSGMHASYSWRSDAGMGSPEAGAVDDSAPPCMCCELNWSPLHLLPEQHLQPLPLPHWCHPDVVIFATPF